MAEKNLAVETVQIPEGISASIIGNNIVVKGPKGEFSRNLITPQIRVNIKNNTIEIGAERLTKRELTAIGTIQAHIKNMIRGVVNPHIYKLKVCSGHFPMNLSITGGIFSIKNFLGEKCPRTLKLKPGSDVRIEGDVIVVESINKESAGQTAAEIERLTRITNRDKRIFQDGIYIIVKDGKQI